MSIKGKLLGLVGIASLGMALTTGLATASTVDSASTQTSVDVSCSQPMTVAITGGDFAPIDVAVSSSTSTSPGAFEVTVDMGCYWGPWEVNASTTNFIAAPFIWFSASHLSLVDATVETYAAEPLSFLAPTATDADFYGPTDVDTILQTQETWIWWPFWQGPDIPAPFTTVASYTGQLDGLPNVLPPGHYTATVTVDLSND